MPGKSRPSQTPAQKRKISRVMHEFKEGELESSAGQKVKNPRQAIAIALSEAGASYKDRQGESEPGDKASSQPTQRELYEAARRRGLPGRSRMTKAQLARALGR